MKAGDTVKKVQTVCPITGKPIDKKLFVDQDGKPVNEARNIAESTLTGIMGRESAYSGRTIEWEQALNSPTRLGPETYQFGSLPSPEVAIPGKTAFI